MNAITTTRFSETFLVVVHVTFGIDDGPTSRLCSHMSLRSLLIGLSVMRNDIKEPGETIRWTDRFTQSLHE